MKRKHGLVHPFLIDPRTKLTDMADRAITVSKWKGQIALKAD
jgi:hypothetical protein